MSRSLTALELAVHQDGGRDREFTLLVGCAILARQGVCLYQQAAECEECGEHCAAESLPEVTRLCAHGTPYGGSVEPAASPYDPDEDGVSADRTTEVLLRGIAGGIFLKHNGSAGRNSL
jgi:hypothetical protein